MEDERTELNSLTIPNQAQYKLSDDIQNAAKISTNFQNGKDEKKTLNQEKLIEIIQNKEHCIKELKLKAFQQSYDIQNMNDAIESTNHKYQQLNEKWQNKFDDIEDKRKLYEDTISKNQVMQKSITEKENENHNLTKNIKSKDIEIETFIHKIDQLKNQIVDQSVVKHYNDILTKKDTKRPQSAANPFISLNVDRNESNVQQKVFKEMQMKLNESKKHNLNLLSFLKQIINITYKQNKHNQDDDHHHTDYQSGDFWFKEALTLIENYPDLFEKHLVSLKHTIMDNLTNLNSKIVESNETISQQNKENERKNKIIKKLKFEIKQNKIRSFAYEGDSMLNMNDQQILNNMELIETFCLSQIKYFESVFQDGTHSISVHKQYLLNELKKQCADIDIKWNLLLTSFSNTSSKSENDVTEFIKHGLDELDEIKSTQKIYNTEIEQILKDLQRCVIYLEDLISSESEAVDTQNTLNTALFSSTKLSLIIHTIEECKQLQYKLHHSIFKYGKHSLILQKHLHKINLLLSDSIHALNTNTSLDNQQNKDEVDDALYHPIECLLREKLNVNDTAKDAIVEDAADDIMIGASHECVTDELHPKQRELPLIVEDADNSEMEESHINSTQSAQNIHDPIITSTMNVISENELELQRNINPKVPEQNIRIHDAIPLVSATALIENVPIIQQNHYVPNVSIPSHIKEDIKERKKQQKKLGKTLKQKTILLQKYNNEILTLQKQAKLTASKRKTLKKRQQNEIKTINKQISNIISRPNNNESSIQEMKRLGVTIVKQRLQARDPNKQKKISKTMIQQMVQRKQRVKDKYMKQMKELEDSKQIKAAETKMEEKRDKIAQDIRILADTFVKMDNDIKNMKQLSESQQTEQSARLDTQRLLEIKRNLPRSMLHENGDVLNDSHSSSLTLPRIPNTFPSNMSADNMDSYFVYQ